MTAATAATQRERQVLNVLIYMHGEYGLDAQFTRDAIQLLMEGPVAGSLAGLAMNGYVTQRMQDHQLVYQVQEAGYELYAGLA